jgi:small redox-active disulfide protein 2
MKIEILGSGCPKCKELESRVKEAVKKAGLDALVEHVYDIDKIIKMGAFSTPAMAIDGKIVLSGRLPTVKELVAILKEIEGE